MNMLAYKPTEFENVSLSVWNENAQTSIDNIESMPPTLRQLVTVLKNLFQKPDTVSSEAEEALRVMPADTDAVAVSLGNCEKFVVKSSTGYDTTFVVGGIYPYSEERPPSGVYTSPSRRPTPISHTNARQAWLGENLSGRRKWEHLLVNSLTIYRSVSDTPVSQMQILTILDEDLEADSDAPNFAEIADKLCKWLGITHDQLSAITGIGTTTFFDWKRTQRNPRPATVKDLLRVYALARAMIDHLGSVEAGAAWFHNGQTRPIDLLLRQDFDSVEKAAAAVLFHPLEDRYSDNPGFAPEPDFDIDIRKPSQAARRAARSVRRGKLSSR